ncbi:hypothetical protein [Polaromonas sp. SM01]|uniref:hypothetical protein n=1 Tax=Polaromonas sp. SM01 TaxID=3085630 RepID=UPI0029811666|nr:hypothetical protein [Polaromonas sp. SM01]MDW5442993.1 hypothetical protein [Polaromonas sp. SM01]
MKTFQKEYTTVPENSRSGCKKSPSRQIFAGEPGMTLRIDAGAGLALIICCAALAGPIIAG